MRYSESEAHLMMMRDKLSIYIPQEKRKERPVERLLQISEKKDRSVNYLVVQAILEFVEREERKDERKKAV